MALLLDGIEIARGPVGADRPKLAVLETSFAPGELTAVAFWDDHEVGRPTLSTAGAATLSAVADRTALRADESDLANVAIELRDADGRLVTTGDRPVSSRRPVPVC